MPDGKEVVYAFSGITVPRDIMVMRFFQKSLFSSGQDFVGVALMRYIKKNLIHGGMKDLVQGYGYFNHTQIRSQMSSGLTELPNQTVPYFGGESL